MTDPTVFTYTRSNGATWGFVVRDDNNVVYEVTAETVSNNGNGLSAATAGKAAASGAPAFAEHRLPA